MVASLKPVVELRGITVSFPGVRALDRVSIKLYPGEVHALMGENGAGKSTLVKALTGVYRVDEGEIRIGGEPRRISGPADAKTAGVAAVYQEFNLCGNLSIGENVMLGHEVRGRFGIDWAGTHRRASETLAELGLGELDSRLPLESLPVAIQQLVAIARAMVAKPRVLVLDEPTSSLDQGEVAKLFLVLRRLREQGVAILFVSHFLEQVFAISDRMTVLRNGRREGEYLTTEIERADLISKMIGKDIATLRTIGSQRRAHRREPAGAPLYRASGLGRRGVLDPTDLELHRGEVVGFAGLRGSGRSELARLLVGAERPDSGTVTVAGKSASISSPAAALRRRIALSSENRREEGIIGELSVRQNIVLAVQALRGWARPLSKPEREGLVEYYVETLGIPPESVDNPVKNLSGGNQQKVLLARWLAIRPRVLILDEPTKGIDVAAKVEVQAHVAQLAVEGMSVVFISSELEEVIRLSDRIVVLKDRQKIGEVSNGPAITVDTVVELIAADPEPEEPPLA